MKNIFPYFGLHKIVRGLHISGKLFLVMVFLIGIQNLFFVTNKNIEQKSTLVLDNNN